MNKYFYNILLICFILPFCNNGFAQSPPIDSLRQLLTQSTKADTSRLEILKELGDEFYFVDFDSNLHYYQIALDLSKTLPHYDIGFSTLRSFGYSYSFRTNDYDKALKYHELAQQLALEQNDSVDLALTFSDMGSIYWKKGQSAKALEYHLKVRKLGETLKSDRIMLRANLSLGVIRNEEGDNEEALQYYADALVQADSLDHKVAKGLILNNMGKAYQDQEMYQQALEHFNKAKKVFTAIRRTGRLALVNYNIGKNYVLQDSILQGLSFYKKALDFNLQIEDNEQGAMIYSGIATALSKLGNHSQAIANAQKGIALLKDVETDLYFEDLYKTMADSYLATGNYKKSLEALQAHLQAKENIARNETSKKIEELSALYEQQKNELEIQKLNLEKEKNAHRLDQSQSFVKLLLAILGILIIAAILLFTYSRMRQLKQFDSLKTKLSKDLHDNIGASLNHIKMLSGRLVRNSNLVSSQERDVYLIQKISDELMFDLYDMLWSLDQEKSTLGDLLERMQDHIDNTIREEGYPIKTDFSGLPLRSVLSMEIKTNVYAIFKEAIHNILKHTSTNPVNITFQSKKGKQFSLTIKNNFDQKITDPQFSSKKGLENMKKRATEIKGSLNIIEKPTSFEVQLDWKI